MESTSSCESEKHNDYKNSCQSRLAIAHCRLNMFTVWARVTLCGGLGQSQSTTGNWQLAISRDAKLISLKKGHRGLRSSMGNHFRRVTEVKEFTELLSHSQRRPIVIFKHSTTCPISAAAYFEMEQFEGDVALVEVQNSRELSREIERLSGIRHESPQVLIFKKGQVVWNASHRQVKAQAVAEAISSIGRQ